MKVARALPPIVAIVIMPIIILFGRPWYHVVLPAYASLLAIGLSLRHYRSDNAPAIFGR